MFGNQILILRQHIGKIKLILPYLVQEKQSANGRIPQVPQALPYEVRSILDPTAAVA